eukprot:GDKJ01016982.1.p1 GENE.GDKJ01016982.1~~GDKJ01016982.1.p1  ORF type:complete len:1385 (+),score=556.55 GDKJ01016982.1:76-4155(+)
MGTKSARLVLTSPEDSDEKTLGYVHVTRASNEKKEHIKDAIAVSSKITAKILHPNYLEGGVGVTTRPIDVETSTFTIQDVKVGSVVSGTIVKVGDKFLVVALSETVSGIVNLEHVNDIPLNKMPAKFSVGVKAKFRVLDVDVEKRRIILTAKKSLVTAPEETFISQWKDIKEGQEVIGTFVGEKPFGMLVMFANKIIGVIPAGHVKLKKEKCDAIKKTGKGALVTARVLKFDIEKKQVTLTLDDPSDDSEKKSNGEKTKTASTPNLALMALFDAARNEKDIVSTASAAGVAYGPLSVVDLSQGTYEITKIDHSAVMIKFTPTPTPVKTDGKKSKKNATPVAAVLNSEPVVFAVPIGHLCDDAQQATRMHVLALVNPTQTKAIIADLLKLTNNKLVTLSSSTKVEGELMALASLKTTLVETPSSLHTATCWADLGHHDIKIGYVVKVEKFGVFVSFGRYAVGALCNKKHVSDSFIQTAEGQAFVGQAIMARIISLSKNSIELSKEERLAQSATPNEVAADMRPTTISKFVPFEAAKAFKLMVAENALAVEKLLIQYKDKIASEETLEARITICQTLAGSSKPAKINATQSLSTPKNAVIVSKIIGGVARAGLLVIVDSTRTYAFVPAVELKDHLGASHAALLSKSEYAPGETIQIKMLEGVTMPNFSITPEGTTNKVKPVIASARVSVLTNTETEKRPLNFADFKNGMLVHGVITNSGPSGVFVQISPLIVARIRLSELTTVKIAPAEVPLKFPIGTVLANLTVISADGAPQVELSAKAFLNQSLIKLEHLTEGAVIKARVKKIVAERGLLITVEDSDRVDVLVPFAELGDSKSITAESFKAGELVKAVITKKTAERAWATMKPSKLAEVTQEESEEEEDEDEEMKNDSSDDEEMEEDEDEGEENADDSDEGESLDLDDAEADDSDSDESSSSSEEEAKPVAKKVKKNATDSSLTAKMAAMVSATGKKTQQQQKKTNDARDSSDLDSSDEEVGKIQDDEDVNIDPLARLAAEEARLALEGKGASSSKLNKRTKEALKRANELALREQEARRAAGADDEEPETVQDFERLLVTDSSRSVLWMKYMAHHLKLSNLGAARVVAERAVKYATLMTEREKTNVWIAYLNMECVFGSPQKFKEILARACQYCDKKEIMVQTIKVLQVNGQESQAIEAAANATSKFGTDPAVWMKRFELMYSLGKVNEARELFPSALRVLAKKEHPAFTAQIARTEFKSGHLERGQTLFEGLLSAYPKRVDLWSQFFDAMIQGHISNKSGNARAKGIDIVRRAMERATDLQGLKAKKMKCFFKRWLSLEAEYGSETHQNLVKEKAREYIMRVERELRGASGAAGEESDSEEGIEESS